MFVVLIAGGNRIFLCFIVPFYSRYVVNMHMKHVSFSERQLMVISDFEHHLMVLIVLPKLAKYNGVCVIGRSVNEYDIEIKTDCGSPALTAP